MIEEKLRIGVIGATGLVGGMILKVLEERGFSNQVIIPVATQKNVGKEVSFASRRLKIVSIEEAINAECDYVIFSAGGKTSKLYVPMFAERGAVVIDNSSAFRKEDDIPLVVPEINAKIINDSRIVANPNCSTIQMVLALAPLHFKYKIKRVVVSTYQSITGTGIKAVNQLSQEEKGEEVERVYPYQIHHNLFPHGGDFMEDGYTTEELKLVDETRKIFSDNSIQITATVVRVPVLGGHSESVNVEFENEFDIKNVFSCLKAMDGIDVIDNPNENLYPMPLFCQGKDEVFVGRIRRDFSQPKTLNLWIVSDNLRKGAATNAVQILQYLCKQRNEKA